MPWSVMWSISLKVVPSVPLCGHNGCSQGHCQPYDVLCSNQTKMQSFSGLRNQRAACVRMSSIPPLWSETGRMLCWREHLKSLYRRCAAMRVSCPLQPKMQAAYLLFCCTQIKRCSDSLNLCIFAQWEYLLELLKARVTDNLRCYTQKVLWEDQLKAHLLVYAWHRYIIICRTQCSTAIPNETLLHAEDDDTIYTQLIGMKCNNL